MKVFLSLVLLVAVTFAEPPVYNQQQQQQQRYYFARQQSAQAVSGPYPPRGWRPQGPSFNLPERQQHYIPPVQPLQQYGVPPKPQQQYGPPPQPQQQYGPPPQPQQQYGPPPQPQQQYGPPPQQQYVAPNQAQVSFFKPQVVRQPQQVSNQYGSPDFRTESTQEIEEPTTVGPLAESESSSSPSSVNEFEDDIDGVSENNSNTGRFQENPQQQQQQEQGEYYVALPDGRLQRVRYVSSQDIEAMRYFAKIRAENVEPLRGPIYAYAPLQKLEVTPGALTVAADDSNVEAFQPTTSSLTVSVNDKKNKKPEKLINPQVDVKPLAQLQIQHDSGPQTVVPLSTSYATYTANYQLQPAVAPAVEDKFILALP